jgi:hypothetical protein
MSTFQNSEQSINLKRDLSIVAASRIVKGIIIISLVIIIFIGAFSYSYFLAKADVEAVSNEIFTGASLEWGYPSISHVVGYARLNNPSSQNLCEHRNQYFQ